MSIREPSQFDPLLQRLLRYFAQQSLQLQSHQQSPPPILHPDRSINRLINSPELPESSFRHAAVLIPIACGENGNSIIFTLRTEHLSSHAGQVSFPGGTQDSDDDSIEHTALRECEEEIGLRSESVRIIGRLGNLLMPSGYCVTPVVGLFAAGTPLTPSPREVAEIFAVPAQIALNPASYQRSSMLYRDMEREVLELHHDGYRIWGATATILHHLACELADS
jgi:8-oxo-dGTP pyrophosphatase MutT (NUDIX family)